MRWKLMTSLKTRWRRRTFLRRLSSDFSRAEERLMTDVEVLRPLLRLYDEVINHGRLEVLDDLYGPGYINHIAPFGLSKGVDGLRVLFGEFKRAFPDQHIVADAMFRCGDLAIARWTITGH